MDLKSLDSSHINKDEFTPLPLFSEKFKDVISSKFFLKSAITDNQDKCIDEQIKKHVAKKHPTENNIENFSSIIENSENTEKSSNVIRVLLRETNIISLFEMPSTTVLKCTEEGRLVEEDNTKYEYLTVGKGKNRKMEPAEAQTFEIILITKQTLASKIDTLNNFGFASTWDMYDAYAELEKKHSNNTTKENKLYDSMIIMERMLANNTYRKQQEYFKGIDKIVSNGNDFSIHILWNFHYLELNNTPALSLCINPENTDILAVGYGKYKYSSEFPGAVCIWSLKNPKQPERTYHFKVSVTSVAFSSRNPNLLAVGFYNGDIFILDIISKEKYIHDRSTRQTSPCYEPIWFVDWFITEDTDEKIISLCQDGRINYFEKMKNGEFVCSTHMTITKIDNKNNEIQSHIPMNRNLPCTAFCKHPELINIYYVGTGYGNVYKCSFINASQCLSFFKAHNGPVYCIQFSKFCKNIFLTCGADWSVKVWIENIITPLIILNTSLNPVMAATFCPTVSTVIVAISGREIFIWDLKRKNDFLLNKSSLSEDTLTTLTFSNDGNNIFTSDTVGVVYVCALINLPKPSDNQTLDLEDGICNSLLIKPHLLKKYRNALKASL